jgi:uncharacterized protein
LRFEWDPEKEKQNRKKHKVAFTEACYVFADKSMLTLFDDEHSGDEDRWVTMGQTPDGKLLVVNHTYRKSAGTEHVRIISARKATRGEERQYFERRIKK